MSQSDHSNPWKMRSAVTVYDNPWITVEHHEVTTPSGREGIYGKVCFKNKALGIIPIDDEGHTWLIGQYRYTLDAYSWEIPMGGGDHSTDHLVSAQAELREETGITAAQWDLLMQLHTSNSVTNEVAYVYLARQLTYGPTDWDDTEQLDIRRLPFAEAYGMVLNQEITDAISVAAILRCHQYFINSPIT